MLLRVKACKVRVLSPVAGDVYGYVFKYRFEYLVRVGGEVMVKGQTDESIYKVDTFNKCICSVY